MGECISSDLLEGAAAIADFFGWGGEDEEARKAGERKVRHLRERAKGCPIRKREGLGIYALRSELQAWLTADETLASERAA
jgi:hypothetical protein